jgi:hypothetical protein
MNTTLPLANRCRGVGQFHTILQLGLVIFNLEDFCVTVAEVVEDGLLGMDFFVHHRCLGNG